LHKLVYLSVMRIVLFYFIFLLQFCVAAQNIGRLHFNNFEPAKKLGIPGVYSMFQDTTGIIWLGTSNGLFRYNGTEIFEFNAAEKKLLGKLNFVFLQDAAGNVIIGSNESICKYDIRTKKVRRLIYFKQAFNFLQSLRTYCV
jgi:ligand-binding sensor domain-containing protein